MVRVSGGEFLMGSDNHSPKEADEFPYRNTLDDGFEYTAPAGSFPPSGYRLCDVAGNVSHWTSGWYREHGRIESPYATTANPRGCDREARYDPRETVRIPRKVTRGGSHLYAPNDCRRYRPAARMAQRIDTSISHPGFCLMVRPRLDG